MAGTFLSSTCRVIPSGDPQRSSDLMKMAKRLDVRAQQGGLAVRPEKSTGRTTAT
jgi:hypothetical protein